MLSEAKDTPIVAHLSAESGAATQKTLKTAIKCTGVGLHGGQDVTMVLRPGEINTGIVFVRTDVPQGRRSITARWDRVSDTRLCTVISNAQGVTVGTIEHLMAALRGCGVDNAVVELNGPEVPIMDGSAAPFVFLVECAGLVSQPALRRSIRVLRPIEVTAEDRWARLTPSASTTFSFEIDFQSRAIAHQEGLIRLANGNFKTEIARARTFGFAQEVEALRRHGLALGGSLENAIVVSGDRVMNAEGLRYEDEFVRHKILDSIGDLYLAGAPILGHFHGYKAGHALNNQLLRALFADDTAWCYDTSFGAETTAEPWARHAPAAAALPTANAA